MTALVRPELFKKMLTVSFAIHVSLLLIMILRASFFPKENYNFEAAVRVDIVDLPDKVMNPTGNTQASPSKSMPSLKEQAVNLNKKKTSSIDKIKQFEREMRRKKNLESIQEEVKYQEQQERAEKVKKILAKGNVISAGTALTGSAKSEFNEYIGRLHTQVQEHWNLPEWLSNANLKATVVVYIDGQGNIKKKAVERSSGDSRFDNEALKSIEASAPFPPPPGRFKEIVSEDGIRFRFPQ